MDGKIERLLWRISAIICNADLIDDAGAALPFEEQALFKYGKDLGLSSSDLSNELEKATEGLEGISESEWQELHNLPANLKDHFFERTISAAAADGNLAAEEKGMLEKVRQKIT